MWFQKCPRVVFSDLLVNIVQLRVFHIVGNHIVGYADNTTIYAVIVRPLLHLVMESLNQDLAAIDFWYLKWHTVMGSATSKCSGATAAATCIKM